MNTEYDDWRAETQLRLQKSALYEALKKRSAGEAAGNQVLQLIDDATHYAFQRTKTILVHMGEFTLHDGDHLFRVLQLMEKILGRDAIDRLTSPELMLLILSAFFHDIGMAPDVKLVQIWRKHWDTLQTFEDEPEKKEYAKFARFVASNPDKADLITSKAAKGDISGSDLAKSYLITEFIRTTHAKRAQEIIQKDWLEKITYRDTNLAVEFSAICFSHNEDPLSVLELDKNYLCGPDIFACLPLVAVILRLADLLDFDAKRTPAILYSHLFVRHPVSTKEWAKHRAVEAWSINRQTIQYHAKCRHPAIEASIHAFCDVIDSELTACGNILTVLNDFHLTSNRDLKIQIPLRVDRSKIETQKTVFGKPEYLYRQSQFNLSKNQVIDLLMGTKLYGDPAVALRELLQNSIDACLLRSALEKSWGNTYAPEIVVKYYVENSEDVLEVVDNGTGMDQYIIDAYYSKVGSSFYKSVDFYDLKSESRAKFTPTSRFGIGILSTFMVADTLEVDTRRIYGPHESSDPINLSIEGQNSIFWIRPGNRKTPGTTTKLLLRKKLNPWGRMSSNEFSEHVQNIIPNPPFKVIIQSEANEVILDQHTFKCVKAGSLKTHAWDTHENIRLFEVNLEDSGSGILGSAVVAVLERNGVPVSEIEVNSKCVEIDGESYALQKSIKLGGKDITVYSTSIEIDDDAGIHESTSTSTLTDSKSKLSLHGIEVAASLFPQPWLMQKNQVKLVWPLPLLLVVDVCGEGDLDLNSARNQILLSEKWVDFEEKIAQFIFTEVKKQVIKEYWDHLLPILQSSKNTHFLTGLSKIH